MESESSSYTTFHSDAASDIIGDFDELFQLYAMHSEGEFHDECLRTLEGLDDKIGEQPLRIRFSNNDHDCEDFMEFLERMHCDSMEHIIDSGVTLGERLLEILHLVGVDIF